MADATRYDLEFMAEIIGGLEVRTPGAVDSLTQRRVMRAQHKLAALAAQLPPH